MLCLVSLGSLALQTSPTGSVLAAARFLRVGVSGGPPADMGRLRTQRAQGDIRELAGKCRGYAKNGESFWEPGLRRPSAHNNTNKHIKPLLPKLLRRLLSVAAQRGQSCVSNPAQRLAIKGSLNLSIVVIFG